MALSFLAFLLAKNLLTPSRRPGHTIQMPRDHHFTIRGIRLLWRYSRLRGAAAGWAYMPDDPKKPRKVLIDDRLSGRERMETEIHEAMHHCFPDICEEAITASARDVAKILHAIGYRLSE